MLGLRLEVRGGDLFCLDTTDGGASSRRPLTDANLARLSDWTARYDKGVRFGDNDALASIGLEIAAFLDEGDAWLSRCLAGVGEIAFEIAVAGTPDDRGRALLDVPWELLATNASFLAADPGRLFRVERRLGVAARTRAPAHRDLALVFMAAHVEGESILNYEQEESAVLQATQRLDLNLMVEESGALEFLGDTLAKETPEALHLSCHGDIDDKGTPVVILETPTGGADPISVGDLAAVLGDEAKQPALIFLSACRTAEHGSAASAFTQALIRAGVANALGWDGSVYDADAIGFAAVFYEHLAKGRSVAHAAAQARRALLQKHLADKRQGQHWHLARVYLGPAGGGPLCAPGKPKRAFRKDLGYREFLDKKNKRVPVASAAEFVGRRRQAQRILRAFRDREAAGVLVHGMGNLGKSSLAARIASRMPHHETVVLFERYDALAVFEAVLKALPPRLVANVEHTWRDAVMRDDRKLADALRDLLEGPFRCEDAETKARPILLIVDDLEQILAKPQPGEAATPVEPSYTAVLAAIITAFAEADSTDSRLLLTSRYTFTLGDGRGGDLADRLLWVPLPPMDAVQRDKQMRAAAVLAAQATAGDGAIDVGRSGQIAQRIKAAAGGNPGLQEILSRPLLKGEADAAERAVAAVEGYLASGQVPAEQSAAIEFFQRVSLETYRAMLTMPEATQLRAATLFSLPVPRPAFHAAGAALGVADAEAALGRLEGLGLVDLYVDGGGAAEAAINPLARPLVEPLRDSDAAELAKAAIGPLHELWRFGDGSLPADPRGLEAARLALLGEAPAEILNPAALAGARFLFQGKFNAGAALRLVEAAVAALDRQAAAADLYLLCLGATCAGRLGESNAQERFLRRGLALEGGDPRAHALLLVAQALRLRTTGDLDKAESMLRQAAETFGKHGDVHQCAVAMGEIADILRLREKFDEALRVRREEQLPVFERLGDLHGQAVSNGKIADILIIQGNIEEALRLLTEIAIPLVQRVGAIRDLAVFQGRVADILFAHGQPDNALKSYQKVQQIFDRLDDVRHKAVAAGKVAKIHYLRGELDEALRIRQEEELPIYERLNDVRSLLVGRTNMAMILLKRDKDGDRKEAEQLLHLALREAQRLQLPEAAQIENILKQAGLRPG